MYSLAPDLGVSSNYHSREHVHMVRLQVAPLLPLSWRQWIPILNLLSYEYRQAVCIFFIKTHLVHLITEYWLTIIPSSLPYFWTLFPLCFLHRASLIAETIWQLIVVIHKIIIINDHSFFNQLSVIVTTLISHTTWNRARKITPLFITANKVKYGVIQTCFQ